MKYIIALLIILTTITLNAQDQTVKKDTLFFKIEENYLVKGNELYDKNHYYFKKDKMKSEGGGAFSFEILEEKYKEVKSLKSFIEKGDKYGLESASERYKLLAELAKYEVFFVKEKHCICDDYVYYD
ncbi:hypothetical protein D7030_01320 [Flavobacteriaceae bacterium AU392]|nr:hypothetical protein D1817_07775 [Flavobacteriaceae bacterium]RKM86519.1 hypothetical protein D7030_01320 [Flavobacteriaceae bacterium AU392]